MSCDVVISGAAIIDVPVVPADPAVFSAVSTPAERIILTSGGDAMNEAVVLSRLGKQVRLISRIGQDEAGTYLKNVCASNGIETRFEEVAGLDTGVNVVLVDSAGERRFFTNPHGGLRALRAQDIKPIDLQDAKIFCFASIFVFPLISPQDLEQIFQTARAQGCLVCADMTSPKHGETLAELSGALSHLDYFFANELEASQITGEQIPEQMAARILQTGARHVILKLGAKGCLLAGKTGMQRVAACPADCIDTTGAGDNFAAGFLSALLDGKNDLECARYANACASVSVEAVGASSGVRCREQVDERYRQSFGKKQSD